MSGDYRDCGGQWNGDQGGHWDQSGSRMVIRVFLGTRVVMGTLVVARTSMTPGTSMGTGLSPKDQGGH